MKAEIIDRGRGPEIAGTRITVYDVMDYYKHGEHPDAIATWLRIGGEQVRVAIRYIEEHKEEVLAEYQKMLERDAAGNPPELQAKLDAISEKYKPMWEERRRRAQANGEGRDAGHG
jgi:uncharacterized protein (DUF433 family)